MAALPEIIPIFPLPDFVLFPRVHVPLHIFEPRYRQMVTDVIGSDGVIGMVMLKGDWERDYHAFPDAFEVGCAGKITAIQRLPDGRFNLTLEGLSEFRMLREIRDRAYRQARIEWCPASSDKLHLNDSAMVSLHDLLINYLGPPAADVWKSLVEDRALRDADLINFLAFHLDIPALEKQTLLEARDNRVACLLDVITFKLEERKLGPGSSSGPSGLVQ